VSLLGGAMQDLAMFKTFTHIARWQASLPDSDFDEEAYTKLALHLLAAIPTLFKANQPITPDTVKARRRLFVVEITAMLVSLTSRCKSRLRRHGSKALFHECLLE
jgi:hypothetical protein